MLKTLKKDWRYYLNTLNFVILFLAFCEKERELLCVYCILNDGHRNHKILSVTDV